MVDDSKKTASFWHNRTDTHMNLKRLWRHTQDLHWFKPHKIPVLRKEMEQKVIPLTKNPFTSDTCQEIKKKKSCFFCCCCFFSQFSVTRYIYHTQCQALKPRSRRTQWIQMHIVLHITMKKTTKLSLLLPYLESTMEYLT